ncbi:MAG: hypothetical protein M3Q69_17310 [Acidobacteriota bacterium]|nr:hypothetical protein [Acidobacteriota bacterium]
MPLLALLVTLISACAATAGPATKPRLVEVQGHEVEPPSLDVMWEGAVAVVRGRVIRTQPQLSKTSSSQSVVTEIRMHVDEVLKGQLTGGEITIHQLAGQVTQDGVTVRQVGVEPLAPGSEYVVFLGWNRYLSRWMVRGSSGVFELHQSGVRPFGKAKFIERLRNQSVPLFIDDLRRIARAHGRQQ